LKYEEFEQVVRETIDQWYTKKIYDINEINKKPKELVKKHHEENYENYLTHKSEGGKSEKKSSEDSENNINNLNMIGEIGDDEKFENESENDNISQNYDVLNPTETLIKNYKQEINNIYKKSNEGSGVVTLKLPKEIIEEHLNRVRGFDDYDVAVSNKKAAQNPQLLSENYLLTNLQTYPYNYGQSSSY
jgi:hypothetical protein